MSCVHATVYQGPGGQAVPALRQQQRAGGSVYLQQQRGTAGRHPAAPQTPALQAQQQDPGQRQPWKPGYVSASVQGGICTLGKAHMRSTPSLRIFPNVALLETVPVFV